MLKIAFRNITKKTKRTTLTLIAIAMLSAICYASCGLIHNIIQFTQDETSSDLGNVHYVVFKDEDITLSNHYIVNKEYDLGLGNYNNITYALRRLENDQLFPFTIEEGRFPTNNHEVLVNRNLGITVGNAIELFYKNQLFSFDVVGVYEPSKMNEEAIYVDLDGGKLNTYYISDRQLELSDNVEGIAELMNVIPEDVIVNDALISQSLLKQYFANKTFLMTIMVIVLVISVFQALLSLKNVYMISEGERQKEIGMLKSIGATAKQIKHLIMTELFILSTLGTLIGILIGHGLLYFMLSLFIQKLYMEIRWWMISKVEVMILTLIISHIIVYVSGLTFYKHLFGSLPVHDLEEQHYDYPLPIKTNTVYGTKFPWKMFSIYNSRMHSQTKNVRESFLFLLIIIALFCYVTLVNGTYKNSRVVDYDIVIENKTYNGTYSKLNLDFVYSLYELEENSPIKIDYITVERLGNYRVLTQPSYYGTGFYAKYKNDWMLGLYNGKDNTGREWCNIYHYPTVLDQVQINRVKEVLNCGTLIDTLNENEYISITTSTFNIEDSSATNFTPYPNAPIGIYPSDIDLLSDFVKNQRINDQHNRLALTTDAKMSNGDVSYPYTELKLCYLPLENAEMIIASSYKNLRNGNEFDGTEQIKIKLKNSSLVFDFEEIIDQLLIDQDVVNEYSYESSAKATEILNMTIFTIDIFFYPFIVLLMCASLFNIHNVLNGNIYIKEKDLRILKSVGMEKKQWRQIIMYEYLEGYISASFFMTIILITISYLSKYFYIGTLLELNIHLISIIFISIFALGPLVLIPICFMNIYLNSINNIK